MGNSNGKASTSQSPSALSALLQRPDSRQNTTSTWYEETSGERVTSHFLLKRFSENESLEINLEETSQLPHTVIELKMAISRKLCVEEDLLKIVRFTCGLCEILEDEYQIKNDSNGDIYVLVNADARIIPKKYLTDNNCIIDGELADDPRVKMTCGHAITQENLYSHCFWTLQKEKKSQILCIVCKRSWDFVDIIERADLNLDEQLFLNRILNLNIISEHSNINICPQCKSYLAREDGKDWFQCNSCKKAGRRIFDFCFKCTDPWTQGHVCKSIGEIKRSLETCGRVTMEYSEIPNVPKMRICPKCGFLIEHNGGCKTMICRCGYVFCFSCLKSKKGKDLGCNTYDRPCEVAPIQSV